MLTVCAGDDAIADEVRKWLNHLKIDGFDLAVLEGLPGAGKSSIVERFVRELDLPCWIVELDKFLEKQELQERSWADTVIARGALSAISKWASEGLTLVEGPASWVVARAWIAEHAPDARVARGYLKAVSEVGGVTFWDAGDGLREHARVHQRFMASIYEYHADERPWTTADVVFQRIGA